MESDDLIIANLSHDNDRMADVFRQAILYAHPDLIDLEVSYNGKNLEIKFDGNPLEKSIVLLTVNKLVSEVTEKRNNEIDLMRIIKNTREIMKSQYGDEYLKHMRSLPYVALDSPTAPSS